MILMILIAVVGYIVQARLQSVFSKYSEVSSPGGMTGAELAEKMLRDNGIDNVRVTHVKGHLTDHFDPRTLTVNLSDSVYSSRSVAAAAVACHECGHAITARHGLRTAYPALAAGADRQLLVADRHVGHTGRHSSAGRNRQRHTMLDRHQASSRCRRSSRS